MSNLAIIEDPKNPGKGPKVLDGFIPLPKSYHSCNILEIFPGTLGGEAPKNLARVRGDFLSKSSPIDGLYRKIKPTEDWFVVKGGYKHYPVESITEHFMGRLGAAMGLNIAETQLVYETGQWRLMSRWFLDGVGDKLTETLIHAEQILETYESATSNKRPRLSKAKRNGQTFVEPLALEYVLRSLENWESRLRTVSKGDLLGEFPLKQAFLDVVFFDAIVGNQDRHSSNWGVIEGPNYGKFAPIYDTARGCFWNRVECSDSLNLTRENKQYLGYLNGGGLVSIETGISCTHFDLLTHIRKKGIVNKRQLRRWKNMVVAGSELVDLLLDVEFRGLFSPIRKRLLKMYLADRLERARYCLR